MLADLSRIKPRSLSGSEALRSQGGSLTATVLDFWRWSSSDLVSNATRGLLAEFIVAQALGFPTSNVRDEWAAHDLTSATGLKVEVKSCAYLQSWAQRRLSNVVFSVRKARAWDPDLSRTAAAATREADVYVFALLAHREKDSLNPLDLDQWEFYVAPTPVLNARKRSQHSITLGSLRKLNAGPVAFDALRARVEGAAREVIDSA